MKSNTVFNTLDGMERLLTNGEVHNYDKEAEVSCDVSKKVHLNITSSPSLMAPKSKTNNPCSPNPYHGRGKGKAPKRSCSPQPHKTKSKRTSMRLHRRYTESVQKEVNTKIVMISSSCPESSSENNSEKDLGDNDSTASTPIVQRHEAREMHDELEYTPNQQVFHSTAETEGNMQTPLKSYKIREKRAKTDNGTSKLNFPANNVNRSAPPHRHPSRRAMLDKLQELKKNLFKRHEQENDQDFYVNYKPLTFTDLEGRTSGVVIPEWIPISFRPPQDIVLDDFEAAIVSYIFMTDEENTHGGEVLVNTKLGSVGDRKTLKTLLPKCPLDQEIINLMVHRLLYLESFVAKHRNIWFLPTMFAQYALDWVHKPEVVMGYYQRDFMGKVEYVRKIFVPMNDQDIHWYLMVVDFYEKKLILLDSSPCPERKMHRRRNVLRVAIFLELMMEHDLFYDDPIKKDNHLISNWPIVEPRGLQRQRTGSNDCGVWVCEWMSKCGYVEVEDYIEVHVWPSTRMRISIDLVFARFNTKFDEVLTKAVTYWKDHENRRKALVKI